MLWYELVEMLVEGDFLNVRVYFFCTHTTIYSFFISTKTLLKKSDEMSLEM